MSYYFTATRMAVTKKTTATNIGEAVEKLEPLYIADRAVKQYCCLGKHYGNPSKS